ncbi:PDRG1 [Branchiostoma lanceolatum]|uniref:PDRG1 protein n=1 Tax=Branchiostoma lanceolatum TaxID=7740 RepID=A0A8K0ACJ6_BRALA|nr:PDRG1 [Branchiostoma lanceolatum]
MARDPNFVLGYLTQVEEMAEEILTDKRQIVDLDKKRNAAREALRCLRKEEQAVTKGGKAWVCFGDMFVKIPKGTATNMLETDQKQLDSEIDRLRDGLQPKVSKLRDMESKPELKGFSLQPLSKEEANIFKP